MSKGLPYLPMYTGDFLRSTAGWTIAERGTYLMLLFAQWDQGPLPNDKRRLAGIAGISIDELEAAWPIVGPKFKETAKGLVNERLEEHRTLATARHESFKARGSKGGKKRWSKERQSIPNDPRPADAPYMAPEFHQGVVAAYNESCAALPPIQNWPEHRAKALNDLIAGTLTSGCPANTLEHWRWFFQMVAGTRFLTGGAESGWRADIEWLLKPEHYCKVVEGGYEPARREGRRELPDAFDLQARRDRFRSA